MVTNGNQDLTCIVTGCNNSKVLLPDKKFFSLPNEEERYHQWLLVCQREDLLGDRRKNINHLICSDHFISNQFDDSHKTVLKDNAIPTVFPFYNNVQAYPAANIFLEGKHFKNDKEANVDGDSTCSETSGHPAQLCRLCASSVEEAVYIFSSSGLDLNLPEKINRSLPVTVKKTDPLPKQLCVNCVMKVSMCDEFSESCLEAEKRLIALMKHKHFRSHTTGIQCEVFCSSNVALDSVVGECQPYEDIDDINLDGSSEKNRNVDSDEQDQNSKLYDSYCCPLCFKGRINIKNNVNCSFNKGKNSTNQSTDTEPGRIKSRNSYDGNENTVIQELQQGCDQKHNELIKSSDESEWQYAHYSDSESRKCADKPAGSDVSEWWDIENPVLNPEIVIETLDTKSLVPYDNGNGQENGDYMIADEEQIILVKEEKNDSNYYCRLCAEQLYTLESCLEHSKLHFNADKYSCILCDSCFSCESELVTHFEDHKLQESKNKTKRKRIICSNCNRRFNGERTFLQHSCISPTKYRCNTCNRAYNSEERLAFHQKFHEGKESYNCDYCNKSFDNEAALYYHASLVHYDERPFPCHICNKKFWAKVSLDTHLRVHSGERPYECHFCNKKFFDKQTQRRHLVTHIKGKPYKCDYCGICLGRMSLLKEHIKRYHLNTCRPKRLPSLIHYYCKICDTTFTNSAEVVSHRTKHWGAQEHSTESINGHICEFCGETFSDVLALGRHRRIKHSDEKPYVCSMCNERSHTLYEARIHRKIHTEPESKDTKVNFDNINTFICESCGNIFSDKRTFMKHLKQHKTNANIPCEVCGKLFAEKQNMTVHMRLHTGEKPYTCEICGKKFAQTSALYTHALLHTGEKPHSCDLCGKSFRIKADRDNHRRTHTGEKPYKCEFCGKQFRTGQVYYQHRMIHTGERRFPCNVCGKAFKRSHTLVVHKRIHTGEKPNICDICGKGFRQRSDMRKHRSIHAVDGVMPKPHT